MDTTFEEEMAAAFDALDRKLAANRKIARRNYLRRKFVKGVMIGTLIGTAAAVACSMLPAPEHPDED